MALGAKTMKRQKSTPGFQGLGARQTNSKRMKGRGGATRYTTPGIGPTKPKSMKSAKSSKSGSSTTPS